jgi:sulfhydrogenase subunit delta
MEAPNTAALSSWWRRLGMDDPGLVRAFRTFNANAEAFRKEGQAHDAR